MLDHNNYLTGMPQEIEKYGLCKTLAVRNEMIHTKHILTEIFIRKTIDIEEILSLVDMDLFSYMEYMTNRIRRIYKLSRDYVKDVNLIVKSDRDHFFPTFNLLEGFDRKFVLDFDGTVTANNFQPLYKLCCERGRTEICSANPTIVGSWFTNKSLPLPDKINSMKGKKKKLKRLLEIQKASDFVFFVDNEKEYLDFAWVFGIKTFHWTNNEIKYYTLKSR
jgi:hypothetical protein